ncbi:hypothetical protein BDV96DRAFT_599714 [Lophiotrema nucula]|uniref:Mid2 domain-containing protein n=1 Tax=Lophiotrema nucula TaxID=690887 RepID=A0A6A5Z9E7_9PLEO|nr:hypothetical protein BDV96DRAFT_599714 [Lophiotrema nucula]
MAAQVPTCGIETCFTVSETTTAVSPSQDTSPHHGLSIGAKVGIAVGIAVPTIALAIVAAYWFGKRKKLTTTAAAGIPPTSSSEQPNRWFSEMRLYRPMQQLSWSHREAHRLSIASPNIGESRVASATVATTSDCDENSASFPSFTSQGSLASSCAHPSASRASISRDNPYDR